MGNNMPRRKCDTCGKVNWGNFEKGDACSHCGQSLWNEYGKFANVSTQENHSPEKSEGECLNKVVDVSQSPSPSGDDLVSNEVIEK